MACRLPPVSLHGLSSEQVRPCCLSLLRRTPVLLEKGPPLFYLKYLLKPLTPNPITLGVRTSTSDIPGDTHSAHSRRFGEGEKNCGNWVVFAKHH